MMPPSAPGERPGTGRRGGPGRAPGRPGEERVMLAGESAPGDVSARDVRPAIPPAAGGVRPRLPRLPRWRRWSLAGALARGSLAGLLLCLLAEAGNHLVYCNT